MLCYNPNMNICGIEKVSLVDFDGYVSTVLFCGGCNFACPFCHNGGLVKEIAHAIPPEEVFDHLVKRKKVLDAVVVSGGEPTLQSDLLPFLKQIKEMGFKTKLDTNGTNFEVLRQAIEQRLVDYVAMDVKNSTSAYCKTTGMQDFDLSQVLSSINLLKTAEIDCEFRTTLVREFHTQETIRDMAQMLTGAKKLFLQKFKESPNCLSGGLSPVPQDQAEIFAEILRKTVSRVTLRGY